MRFALVKSMTRKLTDEEAKSVVEFWRNNQELSIDQVVLEFETRLGMPVTKFAVMSAMVDFDDEGA